MKRLIFLAIAIAMGVASYAQTEQRVVRVHHNGQVLFQMPTELMDSVKSHDRMATFHYGDGSWSRNIHLIDSLSFALVPASDTTVVIDTTAIDTASSIRLHWVGDTVLVRNPYASEGVTVSVAGQDVSVNDASSISGLVYELSGEGHGFFCLKPASAYVLRLNGVALSAEGKPAVNVDKNQPGVVHLVAGTENSFVDGTANDGKACFYSKGALTLQGGGELHVVSHLANGLQGKRGVTMLDGEVFVEVTANTAKGIKTDGDVLIQGGNLTMSASGTLEYSYIDSLSAWDKSYSSCIKPDGSYIQHGGNVALSLPASNAGGKCISTGLDVVVDGGYLTMTTAGAGAILGSGTGSNAEDGYVNACVKADRHVHLLSGHISAVSTGKGGRGICADSNLYVGRPQADNDLLHVYVQTSGATVNPGSSGGPGGWPPQGGNTGDDDYFKGIAKAIRIEGNIYIHSGHLQSYCSQSSGDPTGEAIESKDSILIFGGDIEANAYDDAINAANYIEINGGRIWAYSRGNDGIDCNGDLTINGGLVLVKGNEVGIDSDTERGNRFLINGGTILTSGGTMGAWDTPNAASSQRWVSVSQASLGNNGILLLGPQGDTLVVYRNASFSGSGFLSGSKGFGASDLGTGTKPPGGGGGGSNGSLVISCQGMARGAQYTVYKSATISGGSSWHGLYTGATAQGTGSASTLSAQ